VAVRTRWGLRYLSFDFALYIWNGIVSNWKLGQSLRSHQSMSDWWIPVAAPWLGYFQPVPSSRWKKMVVP